MKCCLAGGQQAAGTLAHATCPRHTPTYARTPPSPGARPPAARPSARRPCRMRGPAAEPARLHGQQAADAARQRARAAALAEREHQVNLLQHVAHLCAAPLASAPRRAAAPGARRCKMQARPPRNARSACPGRPAQSRRAEPLGGRVPQSSLCICVSTQTCCCNPTAIRPAEPPTVAHMTRTACTRSVQPSTRDGLSARPKAWLHIRCCSLLHTHRWRRAAWLPPGAHSMRTGWS